MKTTHHLPPSGISRWLTASAVPLLLLGPPAMGATYQESVSGDLPNNHLAPANLGVLEAGSHVISGSSLSLDRDYIRFNLPSGSSLTGLTLSQYVSANNTAFLGIADGTVMIDPNTANGNIGSLRGYTHFGTGGLAGTALVGTDILNELGSGAGSAGFTPPLGPGDYTLWIQQASPFATQYTFEFTVVPEAETTATVAGALVAGVVLVRRRLVVVQRRNSRSSAGSITS